jgi:hypothetical protein
MLERAALYHMQTFKAVDVKFCERDEAFEHVTVAAQLARTNMSCFKKNFIL